MSVDWDTLPGRMPHWPLAPRHRFSRSPVAFGPLAFASPFDPEGYLFFLAFFAFLARSCALRSVSSRAFLALSSRSFASSASA